jgi:hypothetical protein
VLLGVCIVIISAAACSAGAKSQQVTLSVAQGDSVNEVAKGTLSEMLAQATGITGFEIELPKQMPTNSNVVAITLPATKPHNPDNPVALLDIHVPTGHYLLAEYRGMFTGGASGEINGKPTVNAGWRAAPELEAPGKWVYVLPNGQLPWKERNRATGYAVVGAARSYTIQATLPGVYDAADKDLPKIVKSLPME